jgi:hypothetical protein
VQREIADAGGAVRVFEAGDAALLGREAVACRSAALQVGRAARVARVGRRVDAVERPLALVVVEGRDAATRQERERRE